jgi:lysophospholipase L1-like esterase
MKEINIVFQGDSITDAGRDRENQEANVRLGAGYAALTAARLLADHPDRKLTIHNRGISGHRVVDLYARWKIDTLLLEPDILSILIGVNDTWHEFTYRNGVEVDRYETFYRMLLDWTLKARPKTRIVLIEPFVLVTGVVTPAWQADIDARRVVAANIAKDYRTMWIPAQEIFNAAAKLAPAEYWLGDGVHPTAAGHQLLADAWVKTTAKLF